VTLSGEDESFEAAELVAYAKAQFRNLDLLRALEAAGVVPDGLRAAPLTKSKREAVDGAFFRGACLQMRRLFPRQSDEALENRIGRVRRRLDGCSRMRADENGLQPMTALLDALADTFLRGAPDGTLRVRTRLLAQWQDLVLVVPPLLICSAWISAHLFRDGWPAGRDQDHILDRMGLLLCDSTLPVDDDPFLDHICRTQGLDEVHMHLNGTTEAEKVWCDALRRPDRVMSKLLNAKLVDAGMRTKIGSGVERLLLQEDDALTRELLRIRLDDAIRLKAHLLKEAATQDAACIGHPQSPLESATLYGLAVEAATPGRRGASLSETVRESWHLCRILLRRRDEPNMIEELRFWAYALLRAQFCRLLVQQSDQFGFDQFQHITNNELREETEKDYAERFRQIERGVQRGVDHLEGRFAPKATPAKNAAILRSILRGYLAFLQEDEKGQRVLMDDAPPSLNGLLNVVKHVENNSSRRRLRLSLVPHFIKTFDWKEHNAFLGHMRCRHCDRWAAACCCARRSSSMLRPACRDAGARRQADQAARALVSVLERTAGLDQLIRGLDAASNERHSGPEVFAPAFRRMRRAGIVRMTYHAGEDFAHIVSGLRAMTEAVLFLEMEAGCRIGHGTASGLDVDAWWSAAGGAVSMPMETRLDDLVFARELLLSRRVMLDKIPLIEGEIRHLAMNIWRDPNLVPSVLTAEWRIRSLDPLAFGLRSRDVEPMRADEARRLHNAKGKDPEAFGHFLRRHGINQVGAPLEQKRCQTVIVVARSSDVLAGDTIRALQEGVLAMLQERRISLETLPSSNVRISIHEGYDDHHARNWLGFGALKPRSGVMFSVGSDDPGIFATSIRAEYAHLLRMIRGEASLSDTVGRPERIIEEIAAEAKRGRF
jgi:adenosine deaminase